jgi:hypothetical protein
VRAFFLPTLSNGYANEHAVSLIPVLVALPTRLARTERAALAPWLPVALALAGRPIAPPGFNNRYVFG